MKRAFRALGLSASVLGALLAAGCGASTTNEDVVGPDKTEATERKTYTGGYGEFAKAQAEKAAKEVAAAKDKSAAPKAPGAGK
jgi:hypothetical protein